MSESSFPINDLLRRKLQTSLVIIGLALCVASTLFLLLFATRIGFGISLAVEGKLTSGFSSVFSPFILLLGILVLVVGVVMVSFMAFMMMSQRTRDIGLMKAAGCPNDLLFGYFFTELLIVAFVSCFSGIILGLVAHFGSSSLFTSLGLQVPRESVNFWFVLIIFAVFFAVSLVFGAKPILSTAKTGPAKAISPTYYFGLDKTPGFEVVSKSGFTMKIALRGLYRHRSATIRIVLCLSTVFLLVTVAVAGGTIASSTTSSWVEKAIGREIVLIAHKNMTNQYRLLLSKFYEAQKDSQFNYTDERYMISADLTNQLRSILGNTRIDTRLVLKVPVSEVQGVILGNTSADTKTVGRNRKGESLMIGVEPQDVLNEWFLEGRFLSEDQASEAIVGDTLAQKMFSMPLAQEIKFFNESFKVVGVCLDPIDNGNVTYVPLKALQNVTGISKPNIIMIKTNASSNREEILDQIRTVLAAVNQEFEVSDLNEILDKSLGFLGYIWSTIMFLPIFSLVAASLCLLGYVMLAINEQKQEFGILRALGARPRTVVKIVSGQSLVVLLSSYAVGIAFGIIITLLILVEEPIVTGYTVMAIAGWLLIGLAATFLSTLYPALRFAKKPILETMSQS